MNLIILFLFIILVLVVIAEFFLKIKPYDLNFIKKTYFFTITERKFYEVLKEVAKELNYELFAKVRWADVVTPVHSPYRYRGDKQWWSNWGRIQSKHIDFLFCNKQDYTPLIAVELDDDSHKREDRIRRDDFQTEVFHNAGLKLVRFKPQANYSKEEIKTKINL